MKQGAARSGSTLNSLWQVQGQAGGGVRSGACMLMRVLLVDGSAGLGGKLVHVHCISSSGIASGGIASGGIASGGIASGGITSA